MANDTYLRGTPAGTLEGNPDASVSTGARTPSPDVPARGASRYERGREAAPGGDMSSPSASGASSREYRYLTTGEVRQMLAAYQAGGWVAALRVTRDLGRCTTTLVRLLRAHPEVRRPPIKRGPPKTGRTPPIQRLIDVMRDALVLGPMSTAELGALIGRSRQSTHGLCTVAGFAKEVQEIDTPTRSRLRVAVWSLPPETP